MSTMTKAPLKLLIKSLNGPEREKVEIDFTQVLSKAREDNLIPADNQFSMNIYSLTFDKMTKLIWNLKLFTNLNQHLEAFSSLLNRIASWVQNLW